MADRKVLDEETRRHRTALARQRKKKRAAKGMKAAGPLVDYRAPLPGWGKPLTPREAAEALTPLRVEKVAELLGGPKVLRRRLTTQLEAHDMIRHGFPAMSVEHLVDALAVIRSGEASLAKAFGISWRTVQRQMKAPTKRLTQEQSGRMWKFAEVLAKATEVFGSQRDAEQWMERPATGLEQRRPIDLLATPAGAELVETFLERLEYGVYA